MVPGDGEAQCSCSHSVGKGRNKLLGTTLDHYLLQIQPYNFNSKPKTEATPKTEGAPKTDPQPSESKAEEEEGGSGAAPKDTPPQWYDVDVIKGTQCTVTGYSVSKETAQDQAEVRM